MSPTTRLGLVSACALLLGGCGWLPEVADDEYDGKNAAEIYQLGHNYRRAGNFTKTIEAFERLESSFPFDPYAQQGMLEMAYAHFRRDEYDLAAAVLERFIEQNPIHPHRPYAHYLLATTYFNYGRSIVHYVLPYVRHDKDPTPWLTAFENFTWVVENAPQSQYAREAHRQTKFLRNVLARHEVHVMDFYLRRKAYVAVATRAQYSLQRYHGSPFTADALWYQEQAYQRLAMTELAGDARRVRTLNFPDYEKPRHILKDEEDSSWVGQQILNVAGYVDDVALYAGFDIGDYPPENLTESYRTVVLPLPDSGEYRPGQAGEKVVLSQVESGFEPIEHNIQKNVWDHIWAVVTLEQNVFDVAQTVLTTDEDLAVAAEATPDEAPVEEPAEAPLPQAESGPTAEPESQGDVTPAPPAL